MDYIYKSWVLQIDITSVCKKHCIYCTRYLGHVSGQNRYTMTKDRFIEILDSLEGWPNVVGIMGGEPLLHPHFKEFAAIAAERIPKERLQLWTSGLAGTEWENPREAPDVAGFFGHIHYNPHNATQLAICRHQPLTIAIDEAVPDKGLMWKLINDCWLPRLWAPSVVAAGGYFCEVAGPLDALLFGGKHAWKIEPGWWKRPPEAFQEQVAELCPRCGMCLPMQRQHLEESTEKFTPHLAEEFSLAGGIRLDKKHIEIFDKTFTNAQIIAAAQDWYPTNYRDDLKADDTLNDWEKGVLVDLEPDQTEPLAFHLDTKDDFTKALGCIVRLAPDELPKEFSFYYKGWPFKPLREAYPFVLPNRPQENMLYYRAMLLHFRQILNDADFAELRAKPLTPEMLQGLAHSYRLAVASHYSKQAQRTAASLAGQRVYFWGHGAAWRSYASSFNALRPVCFLDDLQNSHAPEVDGILVRSPEELLAENAPALPSVMFVREEHISWADKTRAKYGKLISGDLHVTILGQSLL